MVLTTHALAGAVIGKNLNNPYLIVIFSTILHYAMDTLHHGEYLDRNSTWKNTTWKVALDIFLAFGGVGTLIYFNNLNSQEIPNVALGVFFSMLPDLFTLLYWKFNVRPLRFLFNFHASLHKHPPFSPERAWTLKNARNDILISTLAIILFFLL